MITGAIVAVEDHGTIGILWVEDEEAVEHPVYLDHRCLEAIVDDYGVDLLGQQVSYEPGEGVLSFE